MTPTYSIIYEGKDVSKDFAPILETIVFKEYLENKAAELELSFENASTYFFNSWYPAVDDRLKVKIGYVDGQLINCGSFFIDDVDLNGSRRGDFCSMRAISARGSSINADAYRKNQEAKSINEIVQEIASELGYVAKGDLSGTWTGIQQGTGLQFLEQIARENGRFMKIEGTELYFIPRGDVRAGLVVGTISRNDVLTYGLTDKASGRITKCTIKCWKKEEKEMIAGSYDAGIDGGGSITLWVEVADQAEAVQRAKNEVENRNKDGVQFELTFSGNVKYRAGVRVKTTGFGKFDKTWYIAQAKHSVSKTGGYTTKITLQA